MMKYRDFSFKSCICFYTKENINIIYCGSTVSSSLFQDVSFMNRRFLIKAPTCCFTRNLYFIHFHYENASMCTCTYREKCCLFWGGVQLILHTQATHSNRNKVACSIFQFILAVWRRKVWCHQDGGSFLFHFFFFSASWLPCWRHFPTSLVLAGTVESWWKPNFAVFAKRRGRLSFFCWLLRRIFPLTTMVSLTFLGYVANRKPLL